MLDPADVDGLKLDARAIQAKFATSCPIMSLTANELRGFHVCPYQREGITNTLLPGNLVLQHLQHGAIRSFHPSQLSTRRNKSVDFGARVCLCPAEDRHGGHTIQSRFSSQRVFAKEVEAPLIFAQLTQAQSQSIWTCCSADLCCSAVPTQCGYKHHRRRRVRSRLYQIIPRTTLGFGIHGENAQRLGSL